MIDSKTEAVLFDLDGTLIDSAPTFAKVLNLLLKKHGKAELPFERIRTQVSHGARALITLGFGLNEADKNFEPLRQELLDIYEAHIDEGSTLFDGMDELLKHIEALGIPWGIVTNKPTRFTFPLIEKLDISDRCAVVICPDDVTHTKPHPEPILLACFRLNVNPKKCIYFGDHDRDIASGKSAGTKTVAALYGYIEPDDDPQNWQADFYINHPLDCIKQA